MKVGDILFSLGQVCIFCKVTSDKKRIYLVTERLKDGDNVIYAPLSVCLDCYYDLRDDGRVIFKFIE